MPEQSRRRRALRRPVACRGPRIYLRDAPIWILDEPTSAIDAEAEQQIFAEQVG